MSSSPCSTALTDQTLTVTLRIRLLISLSGHSHLEVDRGAFPCICVCVYVCVWVFVYVCMCGMMSVDRNLAAARSTTCSASRTPLYNTMVLVNLHCAAATIGLLTENTTTQYTTQHHTTENPSKSKRRAI